MYSNDAILEIEPGVMILAVAYAAGLIGLILWLA